MDHHTAQLYRAAGWGAILACLVFGLIAVMSPPVHAAVSDAPGGNRAGLAQSSTPTPQANVIFKDDFSTYSSRWTLDDSPKASISHLDSALHMRIISPGISVWSLPDFDLPLEDYRIQVASEFLDGSPDSSFGLVLDYRDDEDFYALVMTPQGEWRLLHREGTGWVDLTPADATAVERESAETAVQMRAEVAEGTLSFFVDDQPVGEVTLDAPLTEGRFGLIAQAGKGYIDVSFDDVLVTVRSEVDQP